jgi:hypothetical protein
MKNIEFIGNIPPEIVEKAQSTLKKTKSFHSGWKRLSGLPSHLAYRLDCNYRILLSETGNAIVANHDAYSRKIKNLK